MAISNEISNATTSTCAALACLILIARMYVAKQQPRPFDLSFVFALLGFCATLARAVNTYEVLKYGTASDALSKLKKDPDIVFSAHDLSDIKLGSILSLLTRTYTTIALWSMNSLLLLLYRRFVRHLPWMKHAINASWAFIGISFITVTLATFLECRPFSVYWQIQPAPGLCSKAYTQTILQCVTNIMTDVIIMGISIPIIFIQGSKLSLRLWIAGLISLGIFRVVTTSLRLAYIFQTGSLQATRSFWASINILVATFVANAPVLYGSFNLHKRKKASSGGYGCTYGPASGAPGRITNGGGTNVMASRVDREKVEGIVKETLVTIQTTDSRNAVTPQHPEGSPHFI